MAELNNPGDLGPNVPKELLGEILIKRNIISQQQLAHALKTQQNEGGYIGEVLTRLGFVEERDIVVALIVQCNIPYIAIDKYDVERAIVQTVPKEFALKNFVVPLDRVGDILSVVMADPLNGSVKAELQRVSGCKIAPFIATKNEIQRALDKYWGKN